MIGARFRNVDLSGARFDRRYPDRPLMRPSDPEGFRAAWTVLDRLWAGTVARARTLDPELLHESVGGEWSIVQTLRHLAFAADSWVNRAILGDPNPWDPSTSPSTGWTRRRGPVGPRGAPVVGPGWPEPRSYPTRDCLLCILNEEWEHRLCAERDLEALALRRR